MRRIAIVLLFLIYGSCGAEGPVSTHQAPIQAGTPAPAESTAVASIPTCSGVLLNNERLLTAAHCLDTALDTDFTGDGLLQFAVPGGNVSLSGAAIARSGRIVVVGNGAGGGFLRAYTSSGELDLAFGNGGVAQVNSASVPGSVSYGDLARSGSKYVAVGTTSGRPLVSRYLSDGRPDTSFGGTGHVLPSNAAGPLYGRATAVAIDGSGAIYLSVADFSGMGAGRWRYLIRLLPSGALDFTFGDGGLALAPPPPTILPPPADLLRDRAGRLWVVGTIGTIASPNRRAYVYRFSSDGSVDTSFASAGMLQLRGPGTMTLGGEALQARASGVLLGGNLWSSSGPQQMVAVALDDSGAVDTSFGALGWARVTFGPGPTSANSIQVDAQGRYTLLGSGAGGPAAARFNSNGVLDSTFDADGLWTVNLPGSGFIAASSDADNLVGVGFATNPGLPTTGFVARLRHEQLEAPAPAGFSAQLGATQVGGVEVHKHPSLDIAVVDLSSPLPVNGSTSGHGYIVDSIAPSALTGTTLYCLGYGGTAPVLSSAWLTVASATPSSFLLESNAVNQIQVAGDSGGPCFRFTPQGTLLTSITVGAWSLGGTPRASTQLALQPLIDWLREHSRQVRLRP